MTALRHDPVMLTEVLQQLSLAPGEVALDGTLGFAGHAKEMLARVLPGGTLIGFDWDRETMDQAAEILPKSSVVLVNADYRFIPEALRFLAGGEDEGGFKIVAGEAPAGFDGFVDAILLDLGLNSQQIDDRSRGMSFLEDGPLDMRLDRSRERTAADFLNTAAEDAIEKVLREYGEERWSRQIARVIVDRRKLRPLETTSDLVDCIFAAVPPAKRDKRIHPATRSFQGIRIEVSGELDNLEEAIVEICGCLRQGGRIVVLSYHSLEDRAVKRAFRALVADGNFEDLNRKPWTPTQEEIGRNRRSRSAKLRAIRRIKEEKNNERSPSAS